MRRALPRVLLAVGAGLLIGGIATFWLGNVAPPGDFGRSAYAPLEPGEPRPYTSTLTVTSDDGAVLWTGQHLLGAGLAVLGLLTLAAVGGWLLGRRAGRKSLLTEP